MAFSGAGLGTEASPYIITTPTQLDEVRQDLSAWYELGNDIDMDVAPFNTGNGFTPIGNNILGFNGSFDGKGYVIQNLFMLFPLTINHVGLFGSIGGASLKNIGLVNVNISSVLGVGSRSMGALVGLVLVLSTNTIDKCYVEGGTITNPNSGGTGGLIGSVVGGANIIECFAKVNIDASDPDEAVLSVGGFVGSASNSTSIIDCYSQGEVTVDQRFGVGGFIGRIDGSITNCYSANQIIAPSTESTFDTIGGFAGLKTVGASITDCYYDTQLSGFSNDDGRGSPRTTSEMKTEDTYVPSWNFTDITGEWDIDCELDYPTLQYENKPRNLCSTVQVFPPDPALPLPPFQAVMSALRDVCNITLIDLSDYGLHYIERVLTTNIFGDDFDTPPTANSPLKERYWKVVTPSGSIEQVAYEDNEYVMTENGTYVFTLFLRQIKESIETPSTFITTIYESDSSEAVSSCGTVTTTERTTEFLDECYKNAVIKASKNCGCFNAENVKAIKLDSLVKAIDYGVSNSLGNEGNIENLIVRYNLICNDNDPCC